MAFPLRGAPQALVMLVAERLRAAPKEEVLLGTSLCSSEIRGDHGKGLHHAHSIWASETGDKTLHQEERTVFSEKGKGVGKAPPSPSWRLATSLETQTQQNVIMISRFCAKKL